jgi:hypothetical protein
MRFCLKSPAVGSMKRHWPEEDLMDTEENARIAVVSRGLASAAEDGWRVPPARETGTGVVGLEDKRTAAAAVLEGAGEAAIDVVAPTEARIGSVMTEDVTAEELRGRVMVMIVVEVHPAFVVVVLVLLTTATRFAVEVAAALVVDADTAGAFPLVLPLPKVNVWLASPALHGAWSRTLLAVTAKQVPTAFRGEKENEVVFARVKSWELVTAPPRDVSCAEGGGRRNIPPSARPPQENMMTVLPAARRGSKFMHACV